MGYKVRITALAPAAKSQIDHLAGLLAKLPGLTKEDALHGLQKPPLELPEVPTDADAQKLLQGLRKLGLLGDIIPLQVAAAKPSSTPANSKISLVAESNPERHRIELREELTPEPPKKGLRESKMLWIGLILTVFFLGALIFLGQGQKPQNLSSAQPELSAQERLQERKRKESRVRYKQALEQLSLSEKFLRQAERTPDGQKATEMMQKALQYNPYNLDAWSKLAAKYRRLGNEKAAIACEVRYRQSEELHRTLEGIATYFRGKPKVELSVAKVHYAVADTTLSAKDFHKKTAALYDTVHALHPDKEFAVENLGQSAQAVQVLPGDSFPTFDSWDELQKKTSVKTR